MNKRQLAATIWKAANEMRSKIEANEYKDYILGFIFYRYISEKEVLFFKEQGMSDEDIRDMDGSDSDYVEFTKDKIGYFIAYADLYTTWLAKGDDFDVSDVRRALSAFSTSINPSHKKVFEKIFNTLETGLSKLGDTASNQTKAINELLNLIKRIPMDGRQGYDVLGFIYEYLIGQFAANAGKKAGEFYTPHEVSVLMSEIVADHLKDRQEISIYDPTSGSGSLLINIGSAIAKYLEGGNRINYYAQELKENTFNLTRMNLVMRGISPDNIYVRNADTLEDDWPVFDEDGNYHLVRVDAVVSNPPYSQKWNQKNKKFDPRFSEYGVAPKGKADYAFLLHELYHIQEDGIMTIVLPHGVLFRGNEEYNIRKNLVEKNNIDAIIGLPANIFFGTSIPTLIMVLKRERSDTDILVIDASKGFEKAGKSNRLRSSDIKRIADCIRERAEVPGFSRLVSKDTVRENDYNLNIPRYVDSSAKPEAWDLHSIMFGGIPAEELDELQRYWAAFPGLRETLYRPLSPRYAELTCTDIEEAVKKHEAVLNYRAAYKTAFADLREQLQKELIGNYRNVSPAGEEGKVADDIFRRLDNVAAIDKYAAYQALDDAWRQIAVDLETIQSEGDVAITQVDPHMVTKKKGDKDIEVQEGWEGHILPFDLVQEMVLTDETHQLRELQQEAEAAGAALNDLLEGLDEEEKDSSIVKEDGTAFVPKEVKAKIAEALEDAESEEIDALQDYLALPKKEKAAFVKNTACVDWSALTANKDGTYGKAAVNSRINELKRQYKFEEDSFEAKLSAIAAAIEKDGELRRRVKEKAAKLHEKTKQTIENMGLEQALVILEEKWAAPIVNGLLALPEALINECVTKLTALQEKYAVTFSETGEKIEETEAELSAQLEMLTGEDSDCEALNELKKLLGGD